MDWLFTMNLFVNSAGNKYSIYPTNLKDSNSQKTPD